MNDYYQILANTPLGRSITSSLNLPQPPILKRSGNIRQSAVLLDASPKAEFSGAIAQALQSAGCEILLNAASTQNDRLVQIAKQLKIETLQRNPFASNGGPEGKTKHTHKTLSHIVYDASGIHDSAQLTALYRQLQPLMTRLSKNAKIVLVTRDPSGCKDPKHATATRAIEGFVRSLAKELGKKGSTVNLIYAGRRASKTLAIPVQFLLSPQSAFITGQVLNVSSTPTLSDSIERPTLEQPLSGKTALVTGAARGIGYETAKTLAQQGASVIVLDRPGSTELTVLANTFDGLAIELDISDPDAGGALVSELKNAGKKIDIVVHNAGITRDKTFTRMSPTFWQSVIDINLSAVEYVTEALLNASLINEGGRIVCVSSINGIAGCFGQSNYATSKAGIIGYVQAMKSTLSKRSITINAVAPGFIETQMTAAMPLIPREIGRRASALLQSGLPEDVAQAIAFFSHPHAAGVSGNVLRVCGSNIVGA